jgi:mono/diheme cytochrome c family protein
MRTKSTEKTHWEAQALRLDRLTLVVAGIAILLLTSGSLSLLQAQATGAVNAQALYSTNCLACHGPKGDGDTVIGKQLQAQDLRSPEILKKTDAELSASIINGKNNKMPPFKGKLKTEEVTALLKYVRDTLAKK